MDQAFDQTLDRGSEPLHVAITNHLRVAIESGRLAPGTRLPPERDLATSLGVSRMTVRQALGELEREGLLRRVVGRAGGTFVNEPQAAFETPAFPGVSTLMRRESGANGVDAAAAEIAPAGRRAAAVLGLLRTDPVVVIRRLRLARGKPLAVERASLPAALFPGIEGMDFAGSLYDVMEQHFGLRPARVVETLELTEARPADVRALGVRKNAPLLLVERIAYAADGTPVEFARDRYRPDRARFVTESTGAEE